MECAVAHDNMHETLQKWQGGSVQAVRFAASYQLPTPPRYSLVLPKKINVRGQFFESLCTYRSTGHLHHWTRAPVPISGSRGSHGGLGGRSEIATLNRPFLRGRGAATGTLDGFARQLGHGNRKHLPQWVDYKVDS